MRKLSGASNSVWRLRATRSRRPTCIANFPGREIIILDILRDETSGDRVARLGAVRRQPLAVFAQRLPRVDRRQRIRNPSGLERIRRVGAATHRPQAKLRARFDDRIAHLGVRAVLSPNLQSRDTGLADANGELSVDWSCRQSGVATAVFHQPPPSATNRSTVSSSCCMSALTLPRRACA